MVGEMKDAKDALIDRFRRPNDLKERIIARGILKNCILGTIKYHQITYNLFDDVSLHPEVLKGLEILNYKVENNQPISKEMCFHLVPQLFTREIRKLDPQIREQF